MQQTKKGQSFFPSEASRGGLPAWTYDSEELTELEKEVIFRRNWLLVGHVSEIPNPGDYKCLDVVDERALVVRGNDGKIRAFHNLCRHRGSRVVTQEFGNCKNIITCPFHGWSYNLDGSLRGIAFEKSFAGLDKSTHGLKPLEFEIWLGLIFVRFKGEGASLSSLVAQFDAELAPYRIAEMQPYGVSWRQDFDLDWKSIVDVDNEGYHVPIAHPSLNDLYGHTYSDESFSNGLSRAVGTFGDKPAKLWSVSNYIKFLPEVEHLPESNRQAWVYFGIFPHTVITACPDLIEYYQVIPISVRKSYMCGGTVALPDERREMSAARNLNRRINLTTGNEDTQLVKWAWEGMKSSAFEDIILSDMEYGVRACHDELRRRLPVLNLTEAPALGTLAARNAELEEQQLGAAAAL
ncbi:MAG: aromatic ring-hydroxylating dioxygenase subunit alpha [Rhodospirillaceae bacterium]|nr:aromatic ring-hydroxylating dioxygenase subunit alpha [Rhodospirillaceae bacterium]